MATDDEKLYETALDSGTRQSRLARVYAEALLGSALKVSPQAPVEVGEEMRDLRVGLSTHPEVAEFLASPELGKKGKLEFLEPVLKGRASESLRGLVWTLWKNNRLDLFRNVVAAYLQLLDERAGRVAVKVTATIPLTDEQKDQLVALVKEATQREPVLHVRVDPDLLGGMIVQVGDTVVDTSVRSRLQSLRTLLLAR
jgi:F-type H+-transporting ATPase subunit delta